MKRVKVTGVFGEFSADFEDPTQWISEGIANNAWGTPGSYTVTVTDVTSEYKQKANDAWVAERSATCETAVQALLGNTQDVTHLMMSLYDLTVATNVLGNSTASDISAAKVRIQDAISLMGQINQLRTQRDADIAAYLAANPVN